jgi:hypothetical protein
MLAIKSYLNLNVQLFHSLNLLPRLGYVSVIICNLYYFLVLPNPIQAKRKKD